MNAFKVTLLAIVAVLLVVVIIDRSRQTEQMAELKKSIDQLSRATQQLATQGVTVVQAPTTGQSTSAQSTGTQATSGQPQEPAKDPLRDGNPKLGVNFLLPYDRSHFHPEWVKGTKKSFYGTSKNLNPITDGSGPTSDLHDEISDSLCFRHPRCPEQWMSQLAESCVISDDYKVYTFTLRKGIKWQRPTIARRPEFAWLDKDVELTARDFVFYFDMVQDPDVRCPNIKSYYEDLVKWEAPDDYTFRMTWKRKVYTSLSFSLGVLPLPRHVYTRNAKGEPIDAKSLGIQFNDHWFDKERQAIGVGAYSLESYEPDQRVVFRRNPAYWGAGGHFEASEWNCAVKQEDAQLVGFKNGDTTAYFLRPLKYKSEILDRHEPRFAAYDPNNSKAGRAGEFGWETVKLMRFSYLGWNNRSPFFKDKRTRQAMSHAFPKERLLREVLFGLGSPTLSDVHPDSDYYNRDLKPYAFDLARAKQLLAEAGWKDSDGDGILDNEIDGVRKPFRFTLKYYQDAPEWDSILLIFRDELKKIGVDLVPKTLEFKELMRVWEDKDFDASVGIWGMDWDVDYFQLWHSSQATLPGSSNHCAFANPKLDELADKLRLTFDAAERIAIAKQLQAILHEEQPYTFFRVESGVLCWQNRGPPASERYIDGVDIGLDQFHPLKKRSSLYWHYRN
jgi:ABC-type transport system substrate-binding protein